MSNHQTSLQLVPSFLAAPARFGEISTYEARYASVLELAERYAQGDTNVLIQGESGTGKELMARAIHDHSSRASGPYVVLNCAAIPEPLLHSELFGHARGAFTGAAESRVGALASAHGGTLFLDEIGDAPASVQVALLRALESKCIKPLGQEEERDVDVRVLSATSRAMTNLMRDNLFRVDLYFRLAGANIALAPLRERTVDLADLAQRLLIQHQRDGQPLPRLSDASLETLKQHSWPGNVRELSNVLSGASCLVQGPRDDGIHWIEPEHLSLPGSAPRSAVHLAVEREVVIEGLDYLLPEAKQYATTGLLLVPPSLSRRKERAWERALLLVLRDHEYPWPPWLAKRARRLLRGAWPVSDNGQALRDVLALARDPLSPS